ncbi:conserved hypothetical protein [Trichormus variabilis ATCC 29413]|uniref:Photosystem II oxygen evolving complex protein PsbP n=2 Tax=Anabaena variabilis TaxID=264691 RepID=Q3MEN0_TRIV2|nr:MULTISPECIES: hypothetical protein [Nostocaceae]ABA20556.1 conserved hypothetical protein [Trichormus variabilis ATCC 29413]MBC1217246.1 hypothetical protein [Trichormus variabilis ARAD]MBC1257377.1 hypothetical protein [Trichormus variabilis V5]MBC1268981.1 hypothetical protein [Trichormus variabilis FSR]MBC1300801.1 hypothetical protein [Trichormus variabilis N2B]
MTPKFVLPFIAATLVSSGSMIVEARQPQPTSVPAKTAVSQKKPAQPVPSEWKLFTAPDGRFSVLMPGIPKQDSQTQKTYMGEINLEVFLAQPPKQEVAYLVVYNEFPHSYGKITDPQEILNNVRDMALKTTQSNLLNQRNIRSSNGHPGKEIAYINSGGKITRSRIYLAEGRLYQVMAITTKKQQQNLAKTITGYLNSFHLVLKK